MAVNYELINVSCNVSEVLSSQVNEKIVQTTFQRADARSILGYICPRFSLKEGFLQVVSLSETYIKVALAPIANHGITKAKAAS